MAASVLHTDLSPRCILGAVVTEGDRIVIDKSKLDASNLMSKLPTPQRSSHEIWFQVKSLPQHGVIVVGERNLTVEKPNFSQYILNKYGITYRHDDSETLHDRFVFDTWLNPKGKPAQRPLDDSQVRNVANLPCILNTFIQRFISGLVQVCFLNFHLKKKICLNVVYAAK